MLEIESIERYMVRLGLFGVHPTRAFDKNKCVHYMMQLPEDISFNLTVGMDSSYDTTEYNALERIKYKGKKDDFLDITDMQRPRVVTLTEFNTRYTPLPSAWDEKIREFDTVFSTESL